jgi:hypothetical protein
MGRQDRPTGPMEATVGEVCNRGATGGGYATWYWYGVATFLPLPKVTCRVVRPQYSVTNSSPPMFPRGAPRATRASLSVLADPLAFGRPDSHVARRPRE